MLPEISTELRETMYDIADALRYPVDHRGRVYDVRYLIHVLSFHLARAGCVIDPDRAQIKARRLPPMPGVFDDAVEWVHPDAPSSIDDELAGATLDDIETLSPAARAELIRRAGGDGTTVEQPDLDAATAWHVQTNIRFDDGD